MAQPGVSPLTDPTVQISRSGFLKQDSPGTSGHVGFEAAATDDAAGARHIQRSEGVQIVLTEMA